MVSRAGARCRLVVLCAGGAGGVQLVWMMQAGVMVRLGGTLWPIAKPLNPISHTLLMSHFHKHQKKWPVLHRVVYSLQPTSTPQIPLRPHATLLNKAQQLF